MKQKIIHQFISNTDTEVVLNALICWGTDAILKFNGMFAFSFFDKKKKNDHREIGLGLSLFTYLFKDNQFAFASEQKAIITHPNFIPKINKQALLEYFTFQNIFTEQTLFEDINL